MLTLIRHLFLSSFPSVIEISQPFLCCLSSDRTKLLRVTVTFSSNMHENKVLDEDRTSLNPVGADNNHPPYSQQHQQQRQQQQQQQRQQQHRTLIAMAGVPPGVRMLPPRREARGLPRVLDEQLHPLDRDTSGNSSSNDLNVSFFSLEGV